LPEEFEKLKELEEEIKHFENIKVSFKDISELNKKIEKVKQYRDPSVIEQELDEKFESGAITKKEYKKGIKQTALMVKKEQAEYDGKKIKIKYTTNHYYLPLILSGEKERVKYIKHIIQTPSEVNFVNRLEGYLQRSDHKFKDFDWWLFSKLDESLDDVYIPYYNPKRNDISRFNPDFIFWLQKGDDYFIVFIDPKGTEHTDYERKIDGYKRVFENDGEEKKVINYDKLKTKVYAFLYTDDSSKLSQGYKRYWFDNIGDVLSKLVSDSQKSEAVKL
jgi:hypothetical protein